MAKYFRVIKEMGVEIHTWIFLEMADCLHV